MPDHDFDRFGRERVPRDHPSTKQSADSPAERGSGPVDGPLTPATVIALQRLHGNTAVTRYLSRQPTLVTPKKMFEDDVTAKKWDRAIQTLQNFDKGPTAGALSFLDINQLSYLDDAAARRGIKESSDVRKAIRKMLEGRGVKRPEAGRHYGKLEAKVGKITHGKNGGTYEYPMDITFTPDPALCAADEIAFVQTAKTVDTTTGVDPSPNHPNRNLPDYTHLDRVAGKKFGWYGYMDDESKSGNVTPWKRASPKTPAWMWDGPSWDHTNMTWFYETAVVCRKSAADTVDRKGDPPGFVYAAVTWGFTVNNDGTVKGLPTQVFNKPTEILDQSVQAWNTQAAGAPAQRNAPGSAQDLLPNLT
jgi:hypothetical protein